MAPFFETYNQDRVPANEIVDRFPGEYTGDECVQTANGEVWNVVAHLPERGTGDRHGYIINGTVREIN